MFLRTLTVLIALAAAGPAAGEVPSAASIRDHVVDLVRPLAGRDTVVLRGDLVLELTARANGQSVYIAFRDALEGCPQGDCSATIDGFVAGLASDIATARSIRDALDTGNDGLFELIRGTSGTRIVFSRSGDNSNQNTAGSEFGRNAIPLGVDDFTEYVRAKLQLYSSAPVAPITEFYPISIGQGLGVGIVFSKEVTVLSFAYQHRWCFVIPGFCEGGMSEYIQARARELEALNKPAERNRMTAFLALKSGPGAYWDRLNRKGDAARGVFGNFVEVCQLSDLANWTRRIRPDPADLVADSQAGFALCEEDTAREIGAMGGAYGPPNAADGIAMAQGDNKYESGRLLFVDQWRALAQQLGGLLVSAPAMNMIVYSKDAGPAAEQALLARARAIKARSGVEALSSTVLRWNGNGWSVALDDDAAP